MSSALKVIYFMYLNIITWLLQKLSNKKIVYFSEHPSFYIMMFQNMHKYISDVEIVSGSQSGLELLSEKNIASSLKLGFPTLVIYSDFPPNSHPWLSTYNINIFHGLAEKNHTYNSRDNKKYDLHLVPGEYAKNKLLKIGVNKEKIKMVGLPKLDTLFDGSLKKEYLLKKYNIPKEKIIILYAPTTRDEYNSLPIYYDEIIKIPTKYHLVVKLHPGYNPKVSTYGKKWIDIFSNKENITIADFEDSIPYMFIADMLITDFGSMMFEYAVLNRPIVLLNRNNIFNDISGACDINGIEYKWRDIGLQVEKKEDLHSAIEDAFKNDDAFKIKREKYVKELFFKVDDKSSLRACLEIYKAYVSKEISIITKFKALKK